MRAVVSNERSNDGSPRAIEFRYYYSSLLRTTRIDILFCGCILVAQESGALVESGVHAPISHLQIIINGGTRSCVSILLINDLLWKLHMRG